MAYGRLIPCLDVRDGRVVKGVGFRELRDVGDPVELALAYSEGGADELVLLDIAASVHDRASAVATIERVADAVTIPFTAGGGVRSRDDAARLIDAGADRVAVNSAALARPDLIGEIASLFGSQALVVSIDCADGRVFSHGGTRPTTRGALEWAASAAERGAGEILLTSITHDGARGGYDLDTTVAVRSAVGVPVIASGGAGTARHVADALAVTDAALVASIFHEDPAEFSALRRAIVDLGAHLRPLEAVLA